NEVLAMPRLAIILMVCLAQMAHMPVPCAGLKESSDRWAADLARADAVHRACRQWFGAQMQSCPNLELLHPNHVGSPFWWDQELLTVAWRAAVLDHVDAGRQRLGFAELHAIQDAQWEWFIQQAPSSAL